MLHTTCLTTLFLSLWTTSHAFGALTVISGVSNANQWFEGAGSYTSISFTGYPYATSIAEQYASLGVHFRTNSPYGLYINGSETVAMEMYPQDNWGLIGWGTIEMNFDDAMYGVAGFHPGHVRAKFYSGDRLVYSWTGSEGSGEWFTFHGFIGDVAFDRAVFEGVLLGYPGPQFPMLTFDSLYFTNVPAPSAVLCLLGGLLTIAQRRR